MRKPTSFVLLSIVFSSLYRSHSACARADLNFAVVKCVPHVYAANVEEKRVPHSYTAAEEKRVPLSYTANAEEKRIHCSSVQNRVILGTHSG